MATSNNSVWECRITGHNDNPGGFNPNGSSPGTDRSQQDSPHVLFDGTTVRFTTAGASATITPVGHTVTAADNRNFVRLTGGTNVTAGVYEIISVNVGAGTWTLDRNCTTGITSNGAGRMGGAVSSPGRIMGTMMPGDKLWIKYSATAYSITNATANTQDSSMRGPSSTGRIEVEGYDTTRGDRTGNRPIIRAGVNSSTLFNMSAGGFVLCFNIVFDGNRSNYTSTTGFQGGAGPSGIFEECHFTSFGSAALNGAVSIALTARLCTFTDCVSVTGAINIEVTDCEFYANVGSFTLQPAGGTIHRCLFYNNTSTSGVIRGATGSTNSTIRVVECSFYSNAGFAIGPAQNVGHFIFAENCHAENCGSYAYDGGATALTSNQGGLLILLNCSGYGNTTGDTRNLFRNTGFVSLTSSAFQNPGAGDLSLNTNVNGGELLKSAGYTPTWIRGLTPNGNPNDIGAWQGAPVSVTVGWPTSGMRIPWQQ